MCRWCAAIERRGQQSWLTYGNPVH
jgi:hypothetical protein